MLNQKNFRRKQGLLREMAVIPKKSYLAWRARLARISLLVQLAWLEGPVLVKGPTWVWIFLARWRLEISKDGLMQVPCWLLMGLFRVESKARIVVACDPEGMCLRRKKKENNNTPSCVLKDINILKDAWSWKTCLTWSSRREERKKSGLSRETCSSWGEISSY